jgi:inward rectifier potassium channel
MVTYKNNYLTDAEVKVTLALIVEENGDQKNRFYPMELEVSKVNAMSLSWTIVHPIDDKSPMFNLTEEDLKNYKAEVLIFVKGFDDTFSNQVVARCSYSTHEFVFGAKFRPMYFPSQHGRSTTIEMDKLNHFDKVDISAIMQNKQMMGTEN